jgi:hypothetical protein
VRLAASGPRSSPPALVTHTGNANPRPPCRASPGQARPVTAPLTTHPADLAAFLGG